MKVNILLRLLLIFACFLGIVWFMTPYLAGRILNLGNVTGLVILCTLIVYGIFAPKVHAFIKKMNKKRAGKTVLGIVTVLMSLIIFLAMVETGFMVHAANNAPSDTATVVVLGCRAYGSRPSIMLASRLDAAYDYLTEHPEAVCIVSGGQGPDESMPEAECMYLYLTDKGIAPERIYRESESTSTRENLLFSREIIETEGLNSEIAIVTNEYHEYRASMIAGALELEHSAVSAKTPLWLFPTYYIRELYGIIYEWVL